RMDKIREAGGEVIGGESVISNEVNCKNAIRASIEWSSDRLSERLETADAGFCEKIKDCLAKDPNRKIIVWSGSLHPDGISQNVLKIFPDISMGIIYPGTEAPIYSFNEHKRIEKANVLKAEPEPTNI